MRKVSYLILWISVGFFIDLEMITLSYAMDDEDENIIRIPVPSNTKITTPLNITPNSAQKKLTHIRVHSGSKTPKATLSRNNSEKDKETGTPTITTSSQGLTPSSSPLRLRPPLSRTNSGSETTTITTSSRGPTPPGTPRRAMLSRENTGSGATTITTSSQGLTPPCTPPKATLSRNNSQEGKASILPNNLPPVKEEKITIVPRKRQRAMSAITPSTTTHEKPENALEENPAEAKRQRILQLQDKIPLIAAVEYAELGKQGDPLGWHYLAFLHASGRLPQQLALTNDQIVDLYLYEVRERIIKEDNRILAVRYWKEAARQGVPEAMHNLGICYEQGLGVLKDEKEFLCWYGRAAANGIEEDFPYLEKGVELGLPESMFNMGICCHKGIGVSKNDEESMYWNCCAAEKGHLEAKFILSDAYLIGNGVLPQNFGEAFKLLSTVALSKGGLAQEKLATAQAVFAMYHEEGIGTPKDLELALSWYKIAALNGSPGLSSKISELEKILRPDPSSGSN